MCTKDPPLTQTKIIGEKLVTEASKGGLQFVIYRPEPVSWLGREKGARESFYSHLFLGGIAQLGFLPSTGNCPDWLPVESAAKFLVKIRHEHHAVGKTFHLTNPHPFLSMEKLGNMLVNLGIPMKFISKKKFEAKLVSLPQSNPLKPVLAAANVKDILSEPVCKDFFNTCQLIPDLSEIVPEINHRHIFFALQNLQVDNDSNCLPLPRPLDESPDSFSYFLPQSSTAPVVMVPSSFDSKRDLGAFVRTHSKKIQDFQHRYGAVLF